MRSLNRISYTEEPLPLKVITEHTELNLISVEKVILRWEALSNSDVSTAVKMVQRCINSCQSGAPMYQQLPE
jgi:hypothetical protein